MRSFFAPGRVNLIGEHTDYSGGLVLPVAIDLGVTVSGVADERLIRLESRLLGGVAEVAADGSSPAPGEGWQRYVAAAARVLAKRGRPAVGLAGEIDSTVPLGAGLSSSAALGVALANALCAVAELPLEPLELALAAQEAEHVAVGVPCGIMDQAASVLGRTSHALLLDCATLEHRHVPLPDGIAILVVDSGVRHVHESSGYTVRQAELARAIESTGLRAPSALSTQEAMARASAVGLDEVETRRLRHVVSENERVRAVVAALEAPGGADLAALGRLFRAGHESLRDDYEVSTPELDLLVELAYDHGAVAARLTGGGFGGSVVVLAPEDGAAALGETIADGYATATGRTGTVRITAAADGARELSRP